MNDVWELEQKMELIDSLLLAMNAHHVIFFDDEDIICIDGKQRVPPLDDYCENNFESWLMILTIIIIKVQLIS